MSISQGLKRAVAFHRTGLATRCGDRDRTWGEFFERVTRLAGALRAHGLQSGDRVAILLLNSDRYLEWLYATAWADGVVMPVNIRLAPAEIAFTLNDAEAAFLVVDATFAPMLPALRGCAGLRHIVFSGDGTASDDALDHEALIAGHEPVADADRRGDTLAGLFYTGGTTGRPKGVMLSHTNLLANALHAELCSGLDERSTYLHVAPMFHLADLSATFATTLMGATHAFVPRFEPATTARAIAHWKVTVTTLVPTMLGLMLALPDLDRYDLSSLQCLTYGGSPMPESFLRAAMQRLPHCGFIQGYGMTELSPLATVLDARHHVLDGPQARWLRSAGRAVPADEVRIVDANDHELARGQIGEIAVRGPNVMLGYWRQPEATAQALRNGWMHTGDLGYMDEEAFVFVVDRLKDMIVTGGENVYSVEVENAIHSHPAVAMCAVIGVPSTQWGEQVHAVIVPKDGASVSEADIIAHCRALIAGYKCPRSVEIRNEPLPISGAGKILKQQLRAAHWEGREHQVA